MPYVSEWRKPEIFMRHKGVRVYHVYKNDDMDAGTRDNWYTLDIRGGDESNCFNVQGLSTYKKYADDHPKFLDSLDKNKRRQNKLSLQWEQFFAAGGFATNMKKAIREALDSGELTMPEGADNQ